MPETGGVWACTSGGEENEESKKRNRKRGGVKVSLDSWESEAERAYYRGRAEKLLSYYRNDVVRLRNAQVDLSNWYELKWEDVFDPTAGLRGVSYDRERVQTSNISNEPYIDDALLVQAQQTLQNSLLMSNITSVLVMVITACAGFFLGFLIVRQRGKEIALMRTMGTSNPAIYTGFMVEQMLSVTLGAFIGGAYFLWQPLERLLLFIGVFFVGLTAALVIFLNKNLMTTIKEDES